MPSLVYKGGDTVILDFNVINKSAVPIKNICAKLCERTHFHARNQHTPCKEFTFHTCPLGYFGQEYTCRKIGSVCTKRVDIPPYSTQSVTLAVVIPETVKTPSFESGLITHGYLFELGVQAQGSWFAQYMTAKIYIGDKKGDEDEDEPKVTMKEMLLQNAPPPAYTP
ncbi:hypothetical protein CAEBREN_31552 [Caenorhabditis brenneri]|uniref:Arrestin C-terminal-like domain-containing protein n=1 Tax=Caenorhabditis brenneri TaxID=135651 RepID=G0MN43_CAEBE|nr:hypothetical protein CAEBREN_31552 [Caenorhabditis brenneri]